jgi:hypothetical protein
VESDDERGRRTARAAWPVAKFRLGEEPPDNLSDSTTAAERIAMMWPLAKEAWALVGRPLPTYDRASTPVRVFLPGTRPSDDDDD